MRCQELAVAVPAGWDDTPPMDAFAVWHLLVLALLVVVPLTVVAVVVLIAVRLRRTRRTSEERIAQRTAEPMRSEGRREG